jgi:hypothetical protein
MARLNMWSSVMPGREENASDCLMINGYDCKLCRGAASLAGRADAASVAA